MKRTLACVLVTTLVAGCATASKDIAASYVSPMQYQAYDCNQIGLESVRVQARVAELGGRLDQAASNDQGIAVVGALLFWPALFFLGGTKTQEAEYSRLKGEYESLQQQAVAQKCAPGSTITVSNEPQSQGAAPAAVAPVASATPVATAAPVIAPAPVVPQATEPTRYRLVPAAGQ